MNKNLNYEYSKKKKKKVIPEYQTKYHPVDSSILFQRNNTQKKNKPKYPRLQIPLK